MILMYFVDLRYLTRERTIDATDNALVGAFSFVVKFREFKAVSDDDDGH